MLGSRVTSRWPQNCLIFKDSYLDMTEWNSICSKSKFKSDSKMTEPCAKFQFYCSYKKKLKEKLPFSPKTLNLALADFGLSF